MKLVTMTTAWIALVMGSASAMTVSSKSAHKILRHARRRVQNNNNNNNNHNNNNNNNNRDDNNNNNDNYDYNANEAYLQKYNMKMIACHQGEQIIDPSTGDYEYNTVVVRLCPTESGCDNNQRIGCSSGYGDFLVGLNTFVDAYFDEQGENMQWNDNFNLEQYAQCEEFKVEDQNNANGDGQNGNQWNDAQFFIGPACTSDGTGARLALFTDDTCQTPSDVSFSDIAQGWTLPFNYGGLVSTQCLNCIDDNDGVTQTRQLCQDLYDESPNKCEAHMQYFSSSYGQNNQGCDTVSSLLPMEIKAQDHRAGKIFGWMVFVVVVVALVGYVVWWRKRKFPQRF